MISFIVSAMDRTPMLKVALGSIACQSVGVREIIVVDNSRNYGTRQRNRAVAWEYGAHHLECATRGIWDEYTASEEGVRIACGDWLCFPSEDSYYVPEFAKFMLTHADMHGLDMVYCDMLYDPRMYGVYKVAEAPLGNDTAETGLGATGIVDKTAFLVRRERFFPFPDKAEYVPGQPRRGDVRFIDEAIRRGYKHGRCPGVLVVHN